MMRLVPMVVVLALTILLPQSSSSQPSAADSLVGLWQGQIEGGYSGQGGPGRILRVVLFTPDGTVYGTWAIRGHQEYVARIKADGPKVRVITAADTRVDLFRQTADRLTGTFTLKSGRTYPIVLRKVEEKPRQDWVDLATALVGRWEGDIRLPSTPDGEAGRLLYIDSVSEKDGRWTAQGRYGMATRGVGGHFDIDVERGAAPPEIRFVTASNATVRLQRVEDEGLVGAVDFTGSHADHEGQLGMRLRRVDSWTDTGCSVATPASPGSYGQPQYCVGENWKFSHGGVQRVVNVAENTVVMTGAPIARCPGCLFVLDGNLALRTILRRDGQAATAMDMDYLPFGEGWRFWEFPLAVGKEWRISAKALVRRSESVRYTAAVKVSAYEDVTTKAGKFKAFKVWRRWNAILGGVGGGNGLDWSESWWFAPEVKNVVKFETTIPVEVPGGPQWELVSFELK